ncbi:MAG: glycosyltransferase family A protein [Armatimonadota bacterium]|nr:glycosyltransferase family A protein [Armatimonadota bacterium]
MTLPLVSIVLPTYNRASRLPAAIESCLAQTYTNIELIVVDDGSTDATPQVLARFAEKDRRVRIIRQQNQRLPRALNAGFHASRGAFLTWTSDDNRYRPNAIALMVEALQSNPSVGLVYCDFDRVDDTGRLIQRVQLPGPEMLPHRNCVGPCFLYRREVFQAIGDYDPRHELAEDYDYWLRVYSRFAIMHLEGVSPYEYGVHAGAMSAREVAVEDAAVRVRIKNARRIPAKLVVYVESRPYLADVCLKHGLGRRALAASLVATGARPWSPERWRRLASALRAAMLARHKG